MWLELATAFSSYQQQSGREMEAFIPSALTEAAKASWDLRGVSGLASLGTPGVMLGHTDSGLHNVGKMRGSSGCELQFSHVELPLETSTGLLLVGTCSMG